MDQAELRRHTIPALAQEHKEMRDGLARAMLQPGLVGEIAGRVAKLCLPHFAAEERTVFPAFTVMHQAILDDVGPVALRILPLIDDLSAHHDDLKRQRQAITSAIGALWEAAYEEGNEEITAFARRLRNHERLESEVLYPTVMMIGRCLKECLPSALQLAPATAHCG